MSDWISVDDRLPEQESPVLIIIKHSHHNILQAAFDYRVGSEGWYDFQSEEEVDFNVVTHWMPLPTPPKESEDE